MCISANPFFWALPSMDSFVKGSISSGRTVMMSIRIYQLNSIYINNLPSFYSDGLGKVAWLSHGFTLCNSTVVGKHLQWDGGQERFEAFLRVGQFDDGICHLSDGLVAFADDGDDACLACLDFLYVADHLLVEHIFGGYHHNRHLGVDEGDRAVFHLCCRIAFSVDIGDFLEFQCSFKCHRVVVATPEVEEVVGISEDTAYVLDAFTLVEEYLYLVGDGIEFLYHLGVAVVADCASLFAKGEGKHCQHGHLASESLGRCHTNFWTHVDVGACVGGTWYAGADGIAYSIDESTFALGKFDGC